MNLNRRKGSPYVTKINKKKEEENSKKVKGQVIPIQ